MAKTINAIQKQRINTAANWAAANPVLMAGQIGVISDTTPKRVKVGDGVTAWNSLPYAAEIPGIVSIDPNKILGTNSAGTGYEFKSAATASQIITLFYNDETDSSEVLSSTSESAALKTFDTLAPLSFSKLIFEIVVQSRVEQSANTKCDFTYRLKKDGDTIQTWVDRIIAISTSGVGSGGRNTTTFSFVLEGPFPSQDVYTVTSQNSLLSGSTGSKIRAFRIYGVTDVSLMKGESGYTPYIQNNYWYINGENTGVLALGGINAGSTISFTEATSKDTLISGETVGVLFGKLKKWFSSFGALAWKSSVDYSTEVTNKPTIPAAQIQSDWSQINTQSLDYIKNKPVTEEVIADISTTSNGETGVYATSLNLEKGSKYRITCIFRPSSSVSGNIFRLLVNGATPSGYYASNGTNSISCSTNYWYKVELTITLLPSGYLLVEGTLKIYNSSTTVIVGADFGGTYNSITDFAFEMSSNTIYSGARMVITKIGW